MKIQQKWLQENGKYKCPYCNKEYSKSGISSHIWRMHTEEGKQFNPNKGYKEGIRTNPNKGKQLSEETKNKISNSLKGRSGHKVSFETRKKISEGRKKYIQNNKDYKWSFYGNETIPEKNFRNKISNINIEQKIYQYYIPNESERGFEIDFAIPDLKIGFEINGNQHYNSDGTFTEYHINRKKYFENLGWILIDIHYSICFNEQLMEDIILKSLNNNIEFSININNQIINCKQVRKKKKEDIKKEIQKQKEIKQIEINNLKNNVINSNIDFSKFGWVGQVSKIINKHPQKVNKWMKKYMSEFYEEKCFKRK